MIQSAIRLFIANQNTENLKNLMEQMGQKIKLIDRRNIRWIIRFHFLQFRVNVQPQTKTFEKNIFRWIWKSKIGRNLNRAWLIGFRCRYSEFRFWRSLEIGRRRTIFFLVQSENRFHYWTNERRFFKKWLMVMWLIRHNFDTLPNYCYIPAIYFYKIFI